MIKVLFFAQVRELVACDELSLPCDYATAEQLRSALSERGDKWRWRWRRASSWWLSIRPWCRWIRPFMMAMRSPSSRR